jgi:hypothetical protein
MANFCRPHDMSIQKMQQFLCTPSNFFCKINLIMCSLVRNSTTHSSAYWQHHQHQKVYEFCQKSRWSFALFDHCWYLSHCCKCSFHYIPWYLWVHTNRCVLDFTTFYWVQKVPTWYESSMYVLKTCFHESWILNPEFCICYWFFCERKNYLFNKNNCYMVIS